MNEGTNNDPQVQSVESSACGCVTTIFVGGQQHWQPCLPCALNGAGDLLKAAAISLHRMKVAADEARSAAQELAKASKPVSRIIRPDFGRGPNGVQL
jgi:hypothetical protein